MLLTTWSTSRRLRAGALRRETAKMAALLLSLHMSSHLFLCRFWILLLSRWENDFFCVENPQSTFSFFPRRGCPNQQPDDQRQGGPLRIKEALWWAAWCAKMVTSIWACQIQGGEVQKSCTIRFVDVFMLLIQSYDHTILFTVYSLYTWLTVGLGLMFPLLWLLDINCLENDSCFPSYPCSQRLFQGWQISWSHDLQILWIGDLHSFWSEAQGFVASLPLPARVWREGSTRFSKVLGKPMCTGGSYMIICQDTGWAFFQLLSKKESMLNLSSQKLLCSLSNASQFRCSGLFWRAGECAQPPGQVVGDLPIRSEWSTKWVCPQNIPKSSGLSFSPLFWWPYNGAFFIIKAAIGQIPKMVPEAIRAQ